MHTPLHPDKAQPAGHAVSAPRKHAWSMFAIVAGLCMLYWAYLSSSAQMVIGGDALSYDHLARYFVHDGWRATIAAGPQREPLYPLSVSMSMRLSPLLNLPYQSIQLVWQIMFLLGAQFLIYLLLLRLNINTWIMAGILLYWGFSPAIVNAAFSLYSEIATFPFVLGIILISAAAWQEIKGSHRRGRCLIYGLGLGALLIGLASVKAITEFIAPLYVLPFIWVGVRAGLKRDGGRLIAAIILVCTCLTVFESTIVAYKKYNETQNGKFAMTDRGSWALYGNTERRMQPLNPRRLAAAAAYAPGEGFCRMFFDARSCWDWSYLPSDMVGMAAPAQLLKAGVPAAEIDSTLMHKSLDAIKRNPPQYALLGLIEGIKLFFWESTQVGYVNYPLWMQNLFAWPPLNNGLRLLLGMLTIISVLFCAWRITRRGKATPGAHVLLFIVWFLCVYIGLHTPFFLLTRYAFPLASLFLICIAYTAQCVYNTAHEKHS